MNVYTKIKNSLISSSKLEDVEFRILVYLISLSKNGIAFPSVRTIASYLNKSPVTVNKSLKNLQDKGYILIENRFIGNGKKTSNIYLISEDVLIADRQKNYKEEINVEEELKLLDFDWINNREGSNDYYKSQRK